MGGRIDCRWLLFLRHSGAAGHGTFATLGAVHLHGIGRLALDHGDLALAFAARVLGADGEHGVRAFTLRSDMSGFVYHDGFAFVARHGDDGVRCERLGFGEGLDLLGALPAPRWRAGENEYGEHAESGGRE